MFSICSSSIVMFLIICFLSTKSGFFCFEDFTIYICQRDTLKISYIQFLVVFLNIFVRM